MATNTLYLASTLLAEGDNNKYLVVNNALQQLEDSVNRILAVDLTSGDVTLTESQLTSYGIFVCTGHTVARDLIIPTTVGASPTTTTNRQFTVKNGGTSAGVLTVTHNVAAVETAIAIGDGAVVIADGTDINDVSLGTSKVSVSVDTVAVETEATDINFAGDVAVADDGDGTVTVTIPDKDISEEGTPVVTNAVEHNFVGPGVTVTDAGGGVATITVPGGTTGVSVSDEGGVIEAETTDIDFVGANVTVTDDADGTVTVTISGPEDTDINAVASSRSLVLTDAEDILNVNTSAGAVALTIDPDATTSFRIGTVINATLKDNTNAFTLVAGAGVALNGVTAGTGTITATNFVGISFYKEAADTWVVQGSIGTVA